ncbi:hypothetical protein QP162_18380 [Sphingomonas aurantiaca]|uniref:hypothetical protein n=1 Tax=Sphingomonas aurantiaca TaxID=185949 RepID=UPI002FE26BA1
MTSSTTILPLMLDATIATAVSQSRWTINRPATSTTTIVSTIPPPSAVTSVATLGSQDGPPQARRPRMIERSNANGQ